MNILKPIVVIIVLATLCSCQNFTSVKENNERKGSDTLTQIVKHKNELVLIDTTNNAIQYKITFDTVQKYLLFYENSKIIKLDTIKSFDISQKTLKHFRLNQYNFEICLLNNNEFSNNQQLVLTKDYTYVEMTSDMSYFESYFLFKDVTKQLFKLLNVLQADTLKYQGKVSYVWCSYIDTLRNYLVTEDRLSFNSGTYLVRVFKIEKDTIRKIGESINNHENYKRMTEKYGDKFLFQRMLQEYAEKIIKKAHK